MVDLTGMVAFHGRNRRVFMVEIVTLPPRTAYAEFINLSRM